MINAIHVPFHVYREILLNDFEDRYRLCAYTKEVLVICDAFNSHEEIREVIRPSWLRKYPNAFRFKGAWQNKKTKALHSGWYPISCLPWNRNIRPKKAVSKNKLR